jgi:hypothetical protein
LTTAAGIWVMGSLPCGARELGDDALGPAADGRVWLDVCILGQHLPQMYARDEANDLRADDCERLGLCPDCLGFGDLDRSPVTDPLTAARGIDQVKRPCPNCGGSGRPAIRVTVRRDLSGGVTGAIRPVPHAYVPPGGIEDPDKLAAFGVAPGACLACGMPEDGKGPREEALHP